MNLPAPSLAAREAAQAARDREAAAHLFTLRVKLYRHEPMIVIKAYDGGPRPGGTHHRIDVEVRQGGEVIFPRGATWCATPGCIDDAEAKALVMSLVAMKPGDTDPDYFASHTPAQLEWAAANGESLSCEAETRYGQH